MPISALELARLKRRAKLKSIIFIASLTCLYMALVPRHAAAAAFIGAAIAILARAGADNFLENIAAAINGGDYYFIQIVKEVRLGKSLFVNGYRVRTPDGKYYNISKASAILDSTGTLVLCYDHKTQLFGPMVQPLTKYHVRRFGDPALLAFIREKAAGSS